MKFKDKKPKGNPVGVVRELDKLGRIVIPKEYRKALGIGNSDSVEMLMFDDNTVLIKKYSENKNEVEV